MAVKITLVDAAQVSDRREVNALKKHFLPKVQSFFNDNRYKDVEGEIRLYPNNLLFSGPTKDIDVLMVGEFTKLKVDTTKYTNLSVHRFLSIIECKSHDISGITAEGQSLKVTYDSSRPNVNEQCKKQIDLLAMFLADTSAHSYITSLLWLHGVKNDELVRIAPKANFAFPVDFTFDQVIDIIALQSKAHQDGGFINCAKHNPNLVDDIDKLFAGIEEGKSLTNIRVLNFFSKDRCETLYNSVLNSPNAANVFSGKAGTGKTISLLQIGAYVSDALNKKSLFLTYNTALVSDIKRLLSFAPYTYRSNIDVKSIQKYFKDIMDNTGTWEDLGDYERSYTKSLTNLLNHLDSGNIIQNEYLHALIDEGQDWSSVEKKAILKIFDKNKIIVADGIDQFVTGAQKIDWSDTPLQKLTISQRQKSNIVRFVNEYSNELNIGWEVEPNLDHAGGTVIITNYYSSRLHQKLIESAKELKCEEYDILFLVPNECTDENGFTKLNAYASKGIQIFDGTQKKLRDAGYPPEGLSQCRLYNYASCRGLEGWVTICLKFDLWINSLLGPNPNKDQVARAYLKSLMPLTRAIDHLVITLDNPNSEVGKILQNLCDGESIIWDVK